MNIGRAVRAGRVKKKRTVKEEAPTEAIYIKNCVVGDLVDVIMCAKFQNEIFRG